MRELAQRSQLLDEQLTRTKVRLRRITTAVAPELVGRKGVGPDTASTILVSVGDNPHRLRNERAFASLAGANPIPAIVRLATEPATRAYLERRVSEGRTKTEAIRCIKRYSRGKYSRRYRNQPRIDSRSIGYVRSARGRHDRLRRRDG